MCPELLRAGAAEGFEADSRRGAVVLPSWPLRAKLGGYCCAPRDDCNLAPLRWRSPVRGLNTGRRDDVRRLINVLDHWVRMDHEEKPVLSSKNLVTNQLRSRARKTQRRHSQALARDVK